MSDDHQHILIPHCRGRQNCQWLVCVICHGYGTTDGRWVTNPYRFTKEASS